MFPLSCWMSAIQRLRFTIATPSDGGWPSADRVGDRGHHHQHEEGHEQNPRDVRRDTRDTREPDAAPAMSARTKKVSAHSSNAMSSYEEHGARSVPTSATCVQRRWALPQGCYGAFTRIATARIARLALATRKFFNRASGARATASRFERRMHCAPRQRCARSSSIGIRLALAIDSHFAEPSLAGSSICRACPVPSGTHQARVRSGTGLIVRRNDLLVEELAAQGRSLIAFSLSAAAGRLSHSRVGSSQSRARFTHSTTTIRASQSSSPSERSISSQVWPSSSTAGGPRPTGRPDEQLVLRSATGHAPRARRATGGEAAGRRPRARGRGAPRDRPAALDPLSALPLHRRRIRVGRLDRRTQFVTDTQRCSTSGNGFDRVRPDEEEGLLPQIVRVIAEQEPRARELIRAHPLPVAFGALVLDSRSRAGCGRTEGMSAAPTARERRGRAPKTSATRREPCARTSMRCCRASRPPWWISRSPPPPSRPAPAS